MSNLVHSGLVVLSSFTITFASYWLDQRRKPLDTDDGGGRMVPGKRMTWAVMALALLASAAGCAAVWHGEIVPGSLLAMAGIGLVLLMAPSLSRGHDVIWSDTGIEGPSRTFGPGLGRARTQIRWDEIVLKGSTLTGYSFAEAADGRRVYWSNLYSGFAAFQERLQLNRPDIFGSDASAHRARTTTDRIGGPRNDRPARPVIEAEAGPGGPPEIPPPSGDGNA